MAMTCCQGRVMPGPSGLYRRHTCRARFGERYAANLQLVREHRAETARTGIATVTLRHPAVANTDLAHWSNCNLSPCSRCDYIEAHLDDRDDA